MEKQQPMMKRRNDALKRFRFSITMMYKSLRIKHKVFALISLIMAGCFLITYISLQYAYSIYDEQLYVKSSQLLNLSSKGIEDEMKQIERLSFNVATDEKIQSYLLAIQPEASGYEILRSRSDLSDRLVQSVGFEKNIYSVEIIDALDYESRSGAFLSIAPEKLKLMVEEAHKAIGENRWMYPENVGDPMVTVREIRSYRNLELNKIGTLIFHIKLDQIVEEVLAGTELTKGEMVIMAGDQVIYPMSMTQNSSLIQLASSDKQGYLIGTINGQQYFLTHVRSNYAGWTYYSLIPFEHIFTKIILMKNLLLGGFVVSLLTMLIVAIIFARSITRPIEELIGSMKQLPKDNFTLNDVAFTELSSPQMDEVGQLQRTYRIMLQQIHELITENFAKQLLIKETQFKALQAQINPHFLYNTLESINWLAKMNGQPKISSMVESLGFLLRSSISMKSPLIPIREELDMVKHYITIQKCRFEERLDFEIDIPEDILDCQIPKLTLQPIIENAIQYALEPKIELCRIRLFGRIEEGRLVLVVEDDGAGMDAQLLEKVRQGEASSRGSGIGLTNIAERIVIAFGEPYGLHVESEPGIGTKVTVMLPNEKRDGNV
jgi:two-component system, sensor histidine kinase YesM